MGNLIDMSVHSLSRALNELVQKVGLLLGPKAQPSYIVLNEAKVRFFALLKSKKGYYPLTKEKSLNSGESR